MKKYNCLFPAVLMILLHSVVLAQVAPSQPRKAALPNHVRPSLGALPSNLEELLATSPFHFDAATVDRMRKSDEAGQLAQKGDLEAGMNNWSNAVKDYQQALDIYSDLPAASYGLGDYDLQRGNIAAAVTHYRQAIYGPPDTSLPSLYVVPTFQIPVIHEHNAFRVMEYARLLSLTGQQEEALFVYRHGAQLLNYISGHQHLKLMLPDFGDGPGQVSFTPQRLQALAQVGWAEDHSDFDQASARARLKQALTLFPDSPVPYFYQAMYEARSLNDFKAAGADFDKAAHLSDPVALNAVQWEQHFYQDFLPSTAQAKPAL